MKKLFIPLSAFCLFSWHYTFAQVKDFSKPTDQYFEISKNLEIYSNIFKELNNYYVDPIEPGKMAKTSIDAMLYELDPYTNYFTETDKEEHDMQTTGKYAGIGVGLKMVDSNLYIGEVFENGPIHKAGYKAGDKIVKINDIAIKGKSYDEISLLLKGAPGTPISLEILPYNAKEAKSVEIVRESIEIKSVPFYDLVGPNKDLAYVYLSQFTHDCSSDILKALNDLKSKQPNLKGVVLDLRNNPGGLLQEAVKICNLFLAKGKLVVFTKGKHKAGEFSLKTENDPWDANIPLTVLINNGSASASEIVAGTIQDLDRGVVIGVKSFGKGLVQQVKPLGYNTALKITTAKYYTPSGRCIQAIDYSHRNADGSVSSVPDSLKKAFKTVAGRTVYDGGGIEPDITTKDLDVNRTLIALANDGQIFNFATEYFYKHPSIKPADEFSISDNEYNEFLAFIEKNKYNYESMSENILKPFEQILKQENYIDDVAGTIEKLKADIEAGKKKSFQKSKEDIKKLISNEIVGRYYFQRGKVVNSLYNNDIDLNNAIEILYNTNEKYFPILKAK